MPGVSQLDNMLRWGAMLPCWYLLSESIRRTALLCVGARPRAQHMHNWQPMPMLVSIAPVPCVSEACASCTSMRSLRQSDRHEESAVASCVQSGRARGHEKVSPGPGSLHDPDVAGLARGQGLLQCPTLQCCSSLHWHRNALPQACSRRCRTGPAAILAPRPTSSLNPVCRFHQEGLWHHQLPALGDGGSLVRHYVQPARSKLCHGQPALPDLQHAGHLAW